MPDVQTAWLLPAVLFRVGTAQLLVVSLGPPARHWTMPGITTRPCASSPACAPKQGPHAHNERMEIQELRSATRLRLGTHTLRQDQTQPPQKEHPASSGLIGKTRNTLIIRPSLRMHQLASSRIQLGLGLLAQPPIHLCIPRAANRARTAGGHPRLACHRQVHVLAEFPRCFRCAAMLDSVTTWRRAPATALWGPGGAR